MRDAIIEKLNHHMSAAPCNEADVVYALVQIRKLVEQSGEKRAFTRLVFFCDWAVHPGLTRNAEARRILVDLDRILGKYDIQRPWDMDPRSEIFRFVSLLNFVEDLDRFFQQYGLVNLWLSDYWVRCHVCHLFSNIVCDCPLTIRRDDTDFHFLARLEVTKSSEVPAVIVANPHQEWVTWNWKFILSDGRTFEMPFAAGLPDSALSAEVAKSGSRLKS